MRSVVTIIFGPDRMIEYAVEAPTSEQHAEQAHEWFDKQWVELECEPSRASGKVLTLDKIIGVTNETGYYNLIADEESGREFAIKVAQALEKPTIVIDLMDHTISF